MPDSKIKTQIQKKKNGKEKEKNGSEVANSSICNSQESNAII